jgi:hypothetical protein
MENTSIIVALVAIIGFLLSVSTLGMSMGQNLTHNLTKTTGNVSNVTINNPFLNGRTPFGSAALP